MKVQSDSDTIELSVLIVTYNSEKWLAPCLESVQKGLDRTKYEIIVVDNGSKDNTCDIIRQHYSYVHLITNDKNVGFAAANNQAAEVARGEFMLLLNADTVFLDNNFDKALSFARTHDVAILGPRMVGREMKLQKTWAVRNTIGQYILDILTLALIPFRRHFSQQPTEPKRVEFLVGAALLVNRDTYSTLELFDERFFFTGEERDLCLRYKAAGQAIYYYPGWAIMHIGSGGQVSRFHIENWVWSSVMLSDKHGTLIERFLMRASLSILLVSYMLRCLIKAAITWKTAPLKRFGRYGGVLLQFWKVCPSRD